MVIGDAYIHAHVLENVTNTIVLSTNTFRGLVLFFLCPHEGTVIRVASKPDDNRIRVFTFEIRNSIYQFVINDLGIVIEAGRWIITKLEPLDLDEAYSVINNIEKAILDYYPDILNKSR